jgi:type VI secretion system secreted protein VgrG
VESVVAGKVTHKLKLGFSEQLEIYDYPGEYAQRFDGVDKGGGDQSGDLAKIFADNKRTAALRMQQEAVLGLVIEGTGTCRQFTPGYKFTLTRHFNADGPYLLTGVEHVANVTVDYRSGDTTEYRYHNRFTALPLAQPFRPQRRTPKPFVQGTQSAVVVGPPGEEIFTDRYGRVKVQFHWDRQGRYDADSSCWVRVAQVWAGKRWGTSFWPRIGQEVVVAFQEGDPDQPIIVGSVYNADQMPPYLGDGPDAKHPNDNKVSGIKTYSTKGGGGFNELHFNDAKGQEQIFIHAEKDWDIRVEHDERHWVGRDSHRIVKRDEFVQGEGDYHRTLKGDHNEEIKGTHSRQVTGDDQQKVGQKFALDAGAEIHLKAGANLVIECPQITLKSGGNFVSITPAGVAIKGVMIMLNSGGAAGSGAGASPEKAKLPQEADGAKPGEQAKPAIPGSQYVPPPLTIPDAAAPAGVPAGPGAGLPGAPMPGISPSAQSLMNAAQDGKPHCELCEKAKQLQGMLSG